MKIFVLVLLLVVYALIAFVTGCLYVFAKAENTRKQRQRIEDAILAYQSAMRGQGIFKVYAKISDMEPFEKTLLRWADWGYKNILPANKYNIVKEYIQK